MTVGTWHQEQAALPFIPVAPGEKPEMLVLKRDEEIVGWAFVFPDGTAWLVRPDARGAVHSGSLRTLVNFWASVFDAEIGIPEEV